MTLATSLLSRRALQVAGRVIALGFLLTGSAFGHSVWIEPLGEQLVLRFAEPGGRLEKSPGHLDSLTAPIAFQLVTNTPVPREALKSTNHFRLVGTDATRVVGAETGFPVLGGAGKPGRRPLFHARWQPDLGSAATPMLTLDLVPTGRAGEVRVYFRGEPLPGIKAMLRTPGDEERELTADSDGLLRLSTTESGVHLLTIAHHREKVRGFHGGRDHELLSHNASLAWRAP